MEGDYRHVNFLGGARTGRRAGPMVRRSIAACVSTFNQPYFFAPHFSAGLEGQLLAHRHTRVRIDAWPADARRSRISANPRSAWAVSFGSEYTQQLDLRVGSERPDARGRSDRARPRSDDRPPGRDAHAVAPSTSTTRRPTTCWMPAAGYQVGVHVEAAGRSCPARSTSRPSPSTRGTSSRWANASWWPPASRRATSTRTPTIRATCRSRRSTCSAARRASAGGGATR